MSQAGKFGGGSFFRQTAIGQKQWDGLLLTSAS